MISILDTTGLPVGFDAADMDPGEDMLAFIKARSRPHRPAAPSPDYPPPPEPDEGDWAPHHGLSDDDAVSEALPTYRDLEARATLLQNQTAPKVISELGTDIGKARLSPIEDDKLIRIIKERTGSTVTAIRRSISDARVRKTRRIFEAESGMPMMRRYVFITPMNAFWDRLSANFMTGDAVRNRHWHEMDEDENGIKQNPMVKLLQDKDHCDKADKVTFFPGGDEIMEEGEIKAFNTWTKTDCPCTAGDASRFERHVANVCDGDELATGHILDYLAHLVQKPHIKIRSTILIIGQPGVGKSMIADTMRLILGIPNVSTVEQTQLCSAFNSWMESKQLVIVHELMSMERREVMNRLKSYIADTSITINRKGFPEFTYENRTNFILFSNSRDAASIEKGDRRYFVWESQMEPQSPSYYSEFHTWRDESGGLANIHHYLMTRDLSDFNPMAHAPMTDVKAKIQKMSLSGIEAYVEEAVNGRDAPFGSDVINLNKAVDYLVKEKRIKISVQNLAEALRRLGGEDLGPQRIDGNVRRFWAVRETQRWKARTGKEIAEYLDRIGYFGPASGELDLDRE